MAAMLEILTVDKNEAFTLDEMQLVFSPFPAPLQISVTGTVEEVVGFDVIDGNRVSAPAIGFFGALAYVDRQWIEPDLVPAYVWAIQSDDKSPFDIDGLVAGPRRVTGVPAASDVDEPHFFPHSVAGFLLKQRL